MARQRYDYNLAVIGAGSAGLVAAYIAATLRAKSVLIEQDRMGGDCLNTGCVPSKALLRSATVCSLLRRAPELGLRVPVLEVDFAAVMERVQAVIRRIEPHDSVERYRQLGVECLHGHARLTSPHRVEVAGTSLTARSIVLATGARPRIPTLAGIAPEQVLTSANLWQLRELPRRLLVLGGGPVGCELAQAFARLGSEVTLVQRAPQLLPREDPDIAALVEAGLTRDGVEVLTGHVAEAVTETEQGRVLVCRHGGTTRTLPFERLLAAVGRSPNLEGLGLGALGVELAPRGRIAVDRFLRTNLPSIYCAGDLAGPYQFTHVAGHQGWHAAFNALFGGIKRFAVDYRVIPWATFTDPEVARVGLSEGDARSRGIAYEVTRFQFDALDRAIADSRTEGMVKVLTRPGRDRILGAVIAGPHAGDLIAELVLAMQHRLGLSQVLRTIHIYPTLAEVNKRLAGEWKRARTPAWALRWLERLHRWRLKK